MVSAYYGQKEDEKEIKEETRSLVVVLFDNSVSV
jgi:hypothetical protein